MKLKIGIPKAMSYYKYRVLWESFFRELGCEIVVSQDTNKEILENGFKYSIDESCLPSKIYMGHVYNLIGKCDYIFIPRFCSYKNSDISCVKFNALYDICNNVFENLNIITYNIDYKEGKNQISGFLKIGKFLGKNCFKTIKAYMSAKKKYETSNLSNYIAQEAILNSKNTSANSNILIVGHPYIIYDEALGKPITSYLKSLGANIIFADLVDTAYEKEGWKTFSKTIYWYDNKQLLAGLDHYLGQVDGVIFVSVFTCGPDSLVTEMCLRKIKNKPCINVILDELNSDTGMHTRLESFTDVLNDKKRMLLYE